MLFFNSGILSMRFSQAIKTLIVFFLTAAIASAKAFAAEPISLHYYDNYYQPGNSWNDAVEQIAASSSSIKMLQAATEITYTNGAKYVLKVPMELTLEEINATTDFEFDQRIEVLEYGSSFILPSRRSDFNLFSGGLEELSRLIKADFIPAELFYGTTPSGIRFPLVYVPSRREQKLWHTAYKLDHQLAINGEKVLFTTVSEPSGLDAPTSDMVENASIKSSNALISIGAGGYMPGDFTRMLRFISDADTDIAALDADDILRFKQETDAGRLRLSLTDPSYISSNAEIKDTAIEKIIKPYAIRRFGKRNIAFISLIPATAENISKLKAAGINLKNPKDGNWLSGLIAEIREKHAPDIIAAVSFMPKSDEGWLASAAGIDIVIGPKEWNLASPVKTRIEFSSKEAGNRTGPALFLYPDQKGTGTILCEISRNGKLEAIEAISGRDDKSIPFRMETRNAMKQDIMNSLLTGDALLPDPRHISLNGNPPSQFYHAADFYSASVSLIRKHYKTELAALRVHGSASNILGDVPASIIKHWLGADEPLKTALVPGEFLKKLMAKKAPEANSGNWNSSQYMLNEQYAISGLDSSNSIAGLNIRKEEFYSITIPESALAAEPKAKDIKDTGDTVHSAVIRSLTAVKENSQYRADWEKAVQNEAANITAPRSLWRLNLSNLSLYVSNFGATGKGNGFGNVGESQLSTENQTTIRGSAALISEFYSGRFRLDLGVKADYGKIVFPSHTSENVDSLLYEGETKYKWKNFNGRLGSLALGPFASAGWETEFTKNDGENLKKILRGKGGLKLFEGNYVKEFYLGLTTEQNYTYSPYYTQFAAETGYKFEITIPKTAFTLSSDGSYRRFARSHNDTKADLLDRLEINSKLSASLYKDLTLDIFAKWLYATGKKIPGFGNSLETGFSISYKKLFKLKK